MKGTLVYSVRASMRRQDVASFCLCWEWVQAAPGSFHRSALCALMLITTALSAPTWAYG